MSQRSKAQKLHNYTKFMELLRTSISTKQFNAVSIVGMCTIAQISTNGSKVLLKNGYILKGPHRTFKAAEKFLTLTVVELMDMVTRHYDDWKTHNPVEVVELLKEVAPPITPMQLPEQLKLPIAELLTVPVDKVLRWEAVDQSLNNASVQEAAIAERAKVPGGWLLRMYRPNQYNDTVTFIPDPKNTWA